MGEGWSAQVGGGLVGVTLEIKVVFGLKHKSNDNDHSGILQRIVVCIIMVEALY